MLESCCVLGLRVGRRILLCADGFSEDANAVVLTDWNVDFALVSCTRRKSRAVSSRIGERTISTEVLRSAVSIGCVTQDRSNACVISCLTDKGHALSRTCRTDNFMRSQTSAYLQRASGRRELSFNVWTRSGERRDVVIASRDRSNLQGRSANWNRIHQLANMWAVCIASVVVAATNVEHVISNTSRQTAECNICIQSSRVFDQDRALNGADFGLVLNIELKVIRCAESVRSRATRCVRNVGVIRTNEARNLQAGVAAWDGDVASAECCAAGWGCCWSCLLCR